MKFCTLLVLILSFASFSTAETLEFVFSDFPPFEYTENGTVAGGNKEIIEEACRRLDITPVFTQLPWKRALKYAREGRVDAIFSLFKNNERVQYYNFPEENINTVKMVLITNRENDIEIESMEDLKGVVVGVYLGSSYGEKFDTAEWISKSSAATNESLLRKQVANRTDVVVIDERVAKYWCKKIGAENKFKTLSFTVIEKPTYVAFSKVKENGKNISQKFSEVLKKMKNEGFMEVVNKKYMF